MASSYRARVQGVGPGLSRATTPPAASERHAAEPSSLLSAVEAYKARAAERARATARTSAPIRPPVASAPIRPPVARAAGASVAPGPIRTPAARVRATGPSIRAPAAGHPSQHAAAAKVAPGLIRTLNARARATGPPSASIRAPAVGHPSRKAAAAQAQPSAQPSRLSAAAEAYRERKRAALLQAGVPAAGASAVAQQSSQPSRLSAAAEAYKARAAERAGHQHIAPTPKAGQSIRPAASSTKIGAGVSGLRANAVAPGPVAAKKDAPAISGLRSAAPAQGNGQWRSSAVATYKQKGRGVKRPRLELDWEEHDAVFYEGLEIEEVSQRVETLLTKLVDGLEDEDRLKALLFLEIACNALASRIEALEDQPELQESIANMLMEAADASVPTLADGDPELRRAAVGVIAQLGQYAFPFTEQLEAMTSDQDPEVQQAASQAIERLNDDIYAAEDEGP